MKNRFTVDFWIDTLDRVSSTFAFSVLGGWTISNNWPMILSFSGFNTLYVFLKCMVASEIGDPTKAGLLTSLFNRNTYAP